MNQFKLLKFNGYLLKKVIIHILGKATHDFDSSFQLLRQKYVDLFVFKIQVLITMYQLQVVYHRLSKWFCSNTFFISKRFQGHLSYVIIFLINILCQLFRVLSNMSISLNFPAIIIRSYSRRFPIIVRSELSRFLSEKCSI